MALCLITFLVFRLEGVTGDNVNESEEMLGIDFRDLSLTHWLSYLLFFSGRGILGIFIITVRFRLLICKKHIA